MINQGLERLVGMLRAAGVVRPRSGRRVVVSRPSGRRVDVDEAVIAIARAPHVAGDYAAWLRTWRDIARLPEVDLGA
jgi:hypothetical protein